MYWRNVSARDLGQMLNVGVLVYAENWRNSEKPETSVEMLGI